MVDASLDALRQMIGARSTSDDALLTWALEAATDLIRPDVYESHWNRSNVQYAVLLQAHRFYKRRTSATGVEGFGPEGFAVRVVDHRPGRAGPARPVARHAQRRRRLMLTAMRTAVTDLLESQDLPYADLRLRPRPTSQSYPCIVVGRPDARESVEARTVFDVDCRRLRVRPHPIRRRPRRARQGRRPDLAHLRRHPRPPFRRPRPDLHMPSRRRSSTSPAPPTSPPTCSRSRAH